MLDADDASGLLGGAAPGNAFRIEKRHAKRVAGSIDAIGDETESVRSHVDGHGFFEPGDVLRAHAYGNGERAAAGSGGGRFGGFGAAGRRSIRRRVQGTFEMDGHRAATAAFIVFAAKDAREDFGLAVRLRGIVGKRDPEGHADAVMLVTGKEQAAAGGVACFALLDLLAERRGPTKPDGQAKVNPAIEASRHGLTQRANWLG